MLIRLAVCRKIGASYVIITITSLSNRRQFWSVIDRSGVVFLFPMKQCSCTLAWWERDSQKWCPGV